MAKVVGVNFTPGSAKRISNVVCQVESTPTNYAGTQGRRGKILSAAQGFDRITGLTTAAVTDGNTTITIDNIKVISGVDPREDTSSTSETLTGTKPSSWTADENKKAWLEWNQTDETWDAYQLDGCSVPS